MCRRQGAWWLSACDLALIIFQVACGGSGGGGNTPPTTPTPAVGLSTSSLTFGSRNVGTTSAVQSVTLTNTGNATLSITSIAVAGTNAGDFAQANTCGSSVVAGTNCTISVTFTPTAAGSRSASVSITDNASGSPHTVSLTGTGATTSAPIATLSATALTFPSQTVGTTSSPQSVALSNTGNAALSIASIGITGDFGETTTCGASLAAGASCTFAVLFTPTATGSRSGALAITDNAAGSPQMVMLAGTGTSASSTRTITGFSPFIVVCDSQCTATVTVHTQNIQSDDEVLLSSAMNLLTSTFVDSNTVKLLISFDDTGSHYDPGPKGVAFCAHDGTACCPFSYFAFSGGGNLGGANATEEVRLDPGNHATWKYVLATGTADGQLLGEWDTAISVDGDYASVVNLDHANVYSISGNNSNCCGGGGTAVDLVAGKNNVLAMSQPSLGLTSFTNEFITAQGKVVDDTTGTAPRALAMSSGCGGTNSFSFDEQGLVLFNDSVTQTNPSVPFQSSPTFTRQGTVSLAGYFSAQSAFSASMLRFVLGWDNTCQAAVLAPTANSDGSPAGYTFVLVNGNAQNGTMPVIGSVTDPLLANAFRAVADLTGTAAYVETLSMDGAAHVVKVSWTTANGTTTFSVADKGIATSGVFFGTSMVMDPNAAVFIDFGQGDSPIVRWLIQ
jgi:hypothetical protein